MLRKYILDIKSLVKMMLQIVRRADYIFFYICARVSHSVKKKEVLLLSDSRNSLSGNLFYIDQELKKRGYHPSCILKKDLRERRTIQEKRYLCRKMAEAECILVDDFYPIIYPIPLRRKTKLIQVWHAMGAFKTVGFSRMGKPGGPGRFTVTHRNYTDAIVSSESIRKDYAEAFHMDISQVHATGVPRTDIFFDDMYSSEVEERIYAKYPVLREKKVILFAPTFRGNGQMSAHYKYEWIDFERLRDAFSDEYICVLKMHPFIRNPLPQNLDQSFYLDLTAEREINDLLFIADVLITDYSSVIFEASLLKLHTIFYVPDLEEYIFSRDFYYPFEEYTFGPVARNMDELVHAVRTSSLDTEKLEKFHEKFCSACDGHSAERFVDELIEQ